MIEVQLQGVVLRLLLSIVFGGALGLEREIHGKSAGMRTHMLVALGSSLFTILSYALPRDLAGGGLADPTRIAAQIITGVGFLGAGSILQGRGSVQGLTTAASIWLVAAIGMAAGGGLYLSALAGTLLGVLVLVAVSQFEQWMVRRVGTRHVITALLADEQDAWAVESLIGEFNVRANRRHVERQKEGLNIRIEGLFRRQELDRLLQALRTRYHVRELRVDRG